LVVFFFQAEDGIRDFHVTGVQTCALPIYIEDGARRILSFSPELFLTRRGDRVVVRPMKGTAPRHADPALDERAARELKESEKDRSEERRVGKGSKTGVMTDG